MKNTWSISSMLDRLSATAMKCLSVTRILSKTNLESTLQNNETCSFYYYQKIFFFQCEENFCSGHFGRLCTKGLKVKKMSVPKTEGKSLIFHIGNEFPNMISVTSEVGFYVKVSQLRNLYPQKQPPEVFCEKRCS